METIDGLVRKVFSDNTCKSDTKYTKSQISDYVGYDSEVFSCLERESARQNDQIELIASENYVSSAVLAAAGSIFTNKYAEGYPGKRYYGGCEHVDDIERLAIDRLKKLFGCDHANVQPHSGASANAAVFFALLNPGDTILGMGLEFGGHLTHGHPMTMSGKWFKSVGYKVSETDGRIDIAEVRDMAHKHKPKIIIAGSSSYPRKIDFLAFREIADEVGAYLLCDVAHYSGLIAANQYPNPLPHAHVVTSTTHKTLRGPRSGIIMWNDQLHESNADELNAQFTRKINSAVFPGMQGGPLMHVIAAKAVAFGEALKPEFSDYIFRVRKNADALSAELERLGAKIVTNGTDSHMIVVDLRPWGLTGNICEKTLERAGLTCNKNAVPFDTQKPFVTSGIRLGTPAITTKGFNESDCVKIAGFIVRVLLSLKECGPTNDHALVEASVLEEVKALCQSVQKRK